MKSPKVLTDRVVNEYVELDSYLSKVFSKTRCLYNLYLTVDGKKTKGVYVLDIYEIFNLDATNNKLLVRIIEDDVRKIYTDVSKMMLDDEFSHIFK